MQYSLVSKVITLPKGERGGSVVECRTPEREVRGSRPTAAVLCPWARHFTPRKYWLITQEAMAPSRHDWKIVDWDVKPQHNQPTLPKVSKVFSLIVYTITRICKWHLTGFIWKVSYYQCQKQYYTYLLNVLAKDKCIDTYLVVIYVLTSSTMSVDVYIACVDFEFQNET